MAPGSAASSFPPVLSTQGMFLYKKKSLTAETVRLMLALPIFPGRHQPSIVGANELNFCVRDRNRWTLIAINTNYEMSFLIFLRNVVTHTGFEPMLTA